MYMYVYVYIRLLIWLVDIKLFFLAIFVDVGVFARSMHNLHEAINPSPLRELGLTRYYQKVK